MTDAYDSPLPSPGLDSASAARTRLPGMEEAQPARAALTASTGLLGLLVAIVATFVLAAIAAVVFAASRAATTR